MNEWTRSEHLELVGIIVSGLIAVAIYLLQKRLSDKQRVDHRLDIEEKAGQKIYDIQYKDHSGKIQLYNTKLLSKKYFTRNERSFLWGYPYHAAELHSANFDGLEFVVGKEEWDGEKYKKVGVIPYEKILGVKPEGDSSFNGMIFFVRPKLLQKDKYAIAYKSYRYYPLKDGSEEAKKPLRARFLDMLKTVLQKLKHQFYYKWKNKTQNNKKKS